MRPFSEDRLRAILAWVVIVLVGGPVTAAVLLGVLHGDSPCILCWAERTSMVLISLVGLFVIRYGPKPKYVGMVILLGVWGTFMAIRHSALHLARDVGQGFAANIFGVHTYVWAWFIHATVLVVLGVLLLFLRQVAPEGGVREPGRAGRFATVLFMVVVAANALQAFASTGPPPFIGQGDPVRLSLNPRHWVWSLEELQPPRLSLRGSWAIPTPDPAAADPEPAHGPLVDLPTLPVTTWERVDIPLEGALSGLAMDPGTERFLATTDEYGVYVLDGTLSRVLHRVVLDKGFSVDLSPLAGATFVGADTLAVLSTNKSYALLTPDPDTDEDREWRHFLSTSGGVRELRLSRFQTVRAHQMYALSFAFDPRAQELITVSVPNPRHRQLVVSRFAREDFVLASEFRPRLSAGLAMAGPDRDLADYVVTGAVVEDGWLYAVSAAYSTLLVIDLEGKEVSAAYAIPDLQGPVGLAARGSELLVAQADGRVAVVERPSPAGLGAQDAMRPDLSDIASGDGWTVSNRGASVATEGGRVVATFDGRPGDGAAWLEGSDFHNGTIEVRVRGRNNPGRSFVGVAFRGVDDETFDAIYFRPFNFLAGNDLSRSHSVQYISHPVNTWSKLRTEHPGEYENSLVDPPDPDAFFRARIVIRKPEIRVYVGDQTEPSLVVSELTDRTGGRIGLWMGNSSDGSFADLVIRPAR